MSAIRHISDRSSSPVSVDVSPSVSGTDSADTADRLFGSRYQAHRRIKRGRNVETLAGTDLVTGHEVVIKATTDGSIPAAVRARLEHEVGVLKRVHNQSLVSAIEVGHDGHQLYFVMPFVDGETLEARLQRGPLSLSETLSVAVCLLQALRAAHDHGVLHRDVKPANLIVNAGNHVSPTNGTVPRAGGNSRGDSSASVTSGGVLSATLIDFGLARSMRLDASLRDQPVGTARYISPEQAGLLDQPVDEPSDLYSVGIVLFECLAGHAPFMADSISEALRLHATQQPPELRSLGIEVPRAVDEVIQRLLRKDPRDRYQSAAAVLADVDLIRETLRNGLAEVPIVVGCHDRRGTLTEPAFVGRQSELDSLLREVRRASVGTGGLTLLESESGGGKTRLLQELGQQASRLGFRLLRGHALDQVVRSPLQVLAGVARDLVAMARTTHAAEEQAWIDQFTARLGHHTGMIAAAMPELARELNWSRHDLLGPEAFGETRTLLALTALLDAVGTQSQPVVVILDDFQWADELSVKLIEHWHCREGLTDLSYVSLVAAFRGEEVAENHRLRHLDPALHISLMPFSTVDVGRLAESMAGPLPSEALQLVERLADGSPFMASAVLRGLVESRVLLPGRSGWSVDPLGLADVQSSHHAGAFLARRISLLPPDTLRLLSVAAVLGKEFDLDTLARVAGESPEVSIVSLTEARRRHLVWPVGEGTEFSFVHDQIRVTLTERLPAAELRTLHEQAARCLEVHHPDRVFEIACHFGAAGRYAEALPFALKGATVARARHSLEIAEQLYQIAVEGAEATDAETQCLVTEGLGDILMLRGRYRPATDQFRKAQTLARDDTSQARIDGKLGEVAFKQGDMQTAVRNLESALRRLGQFVPGSKLTLIAAFLWEVAIQVLHTVFSKRIQTRHRAPTETERTLMRLHGRLAYAYWFARGALPCLWTHIREMNLSERCQPTLERAQAYSTHAPAMSLLPYFSRAIRYVETSLQIRRSFDDVWGQGQSLHFYGVVLYAASQFEECITRCREAVRLLERTGDYWEMNIARYQIAASLYRQGKLRAAIAEARRIHESGLEIGDAQASGISLDIWSRASQGNLPEDVVRTEVERDRFDPQGTAQVLIAEGVRLLLGERNPFGAIEVFEQAHRVAAAGDIENAWVSPILPWLATALRTAAEQADPYQTSLRRDLLRRADRAARRGQRMARKFQSDLPHVLRERGLLAALAGQSARARRFLNESIAIAERQGADYEHAQSQLARGQLGQLYGWTHAKDDIAAARDALAVMEEGVLDAATTAPRNRVTISLADRFDMLLETGRLITSSLARDTIMAAVTDAGLRLLRAEHCVIVDVKQATGTTAPDSRLVAGTEHRDGEVVRQASLQQAITAGRAVALVEDVSEGTSESVVLPGTRSVLCAPIMVRGEFEACLYATHSHIVDFFTEDEERLADFVVAIAGAALENAEGFRELERLNDELFANKMTLEMRVNERTSELESQRSELDTQRVELERSNKELVQFAYVTSHDLQEPLRTVGSYCQLLKTRYSEQLDDRANDFVDRAVAGVERMTRLIQDLLEYSRVNTHRNPFEPTNPKRVLERVLGGLKAAITASEAVITSPADLPTVLADASQLERVLQNLIANAIKFRSADRPIQVHVDCESRGEFCEFTIRDNGIGIESAHYDRIFQIFQRLHGRNKYEGTGIGLAIVKKIIEQHGGTIHVDSTPGQGTAFRFTIPAWLPPGNSSQEPDCQTPMD